MSNPYNLDLNWFEDSITELADRLHSAFADREMQDVKEIFMKKPSTLTPAHLEIVSMVKEGVNNAFNEIYEHFWNESFTAVYNPTISLLDWQEMQKNKRSDVVSNIVAYLRLEFPPECQPPECHPKKKFLI